MKREELVNYLDGLMMPGKFRDYCPNGLQVEGCSEVTRLVAGVTASQALLVRQGRVFDFGGDRNQRTLRPSAVFSSSGKARMAG